MKYISEADLRAYLINDGCDDGCGYLDERDIPSLPWIELDDDEKQKVGHWIADVDRWGEIVTTVNGYRCSECNIFNTDKDNYCSNCGARMESEG